MNLDAKKIRKRQRLKKKKLIDSIIETQVKQIMDSIKRFKMNQELKYTYSTFMPGIPTLSNDTHEYILQKIAKELQKQKCKVVLRGHTFLIQWRANVYSKQELNHYLAEIIHHIYKKINEIPSESNQRCIEYQIPLHLKFDSSVVREKLYNFFMEKHFNVRVQNNKIYILW